MLSSPLGVVTVVLSVILTTRASSSVMLPTAVSATLPSKLVGRSVVVTMGVSVSVVLLGAGARRLCSRTMPRMAIAARIAVVMIKFFFFIRVRFRSFLGQIVVLGMCCERLLLLV